MKDESFTHSLNNMKKKTKNKIGWILVILFAIGLSVLLFFSIKQGWLTSIRNSITDTHQDDKTNYLCCSSTNGYFCSLDYCPLGSGKVYTGGFDSLSACQTKCKTPTQNTPTPTPTSTPAALTCQQEVANNNADGFASVSSDVCHQQAITECQQLGKVIIGWASSSTVSNCCYFQCEDLPPATSDCVSDCAEAVYSGGIPASADGQCSPGLQLIQLVDQFNDKCCCIV